MNASVSVSYLVLDGDADHAMACCWLDPLRPSADGPIFERAIERGWRRVVLVYDRGEEKNILAYQMDNDSDAVEIALCGWRVISGDDASVMSVYDHADPEYVIDRYTWFAHPKVISPYYHIIDEIFEDDSTCVDQPLRDGAVHIEMTKENFKKLMAAVGYSA